MHGSGTFLLLSGFALVLGCAAPPKAVAPVSPQGPPALAVQPAQAVLTTGQGLDFQAGARDGSHPAVAWEATGGTVDASGHFTAPAAPGTFEVRARAWGGRMAVASVRVVPPPAGPITATDPILPNTSNLKASVPEQPGCTYAWSIQGGLLTGDPKGAQVTFASGADRTVTLACRITNAAGLAKTVSLEAALAAPLRLTVSPASATLTAGRERTFGYELKGGLNGHVVWSVLEPGGGTVDARGRYHAPLVAGTYTVQVACKEDPTVRANLPVKVVPAPFGQLRGPGRFAPGAKGLTVSVPGQDGCTYVWTVGGGTLTSAKGPVITFDAGDTTVVDIACVITNEAGDSLRLTLRAKANTP